jgi:hypothetical protein
MAIIYSYPYDQIVTDTDAWVGTDSINRQTKQYTAKAVADYLNINGRIAIAGQMNYQFVEDPSFKGGTFAFPAGQGDNTPWSSITSVVISNMDLSGQIVSPFLAYLIDEQVMFQDVAGKGSFGHYIMRGYAQIGVTNFYTLTLEYIGGNGSIDMDHYYTLVNFYLESASTVGVNSIDASDTAFINMTPTTPTTGNVGITASLSATGTPDNTNFLRGDNTWVEADKTFEFTQAVAATTWNIQHSLGKFPSVSVTNNNNVVINGEVKYIDNNNVQLNFSAGFSGKAYLN